MRQEDNDSDRIDLRNLPEEEARFVKEFAKEYEDNDWEMRRLLKEYVNERRRAAKMETKTEVKSSGTICPGEEFTAPQVHRPKKIIPIAKVKPQDSLTRCCVRNRNIRIHPLFRIKEISDVPKLKS